MDDIVIRGGQVIDGTGAPTRQHVGAMSALPMEADVSASPGPLDASRSIPALSDCATQGDTSWKRTASLSG